MSTLSCKIHSKQFRGALAALLLGMAPLGAEAAQATPTPGENVKEMQGQQPASLENTVPDKANNPSDAEFHVKKIQLEAPDMKVHQNRLNSIAAKYEGKDTSLAGLNGLLDELARYCRRHNYPAATAYIPSQDIVNGNLKITIMPGKLGKITIDNQSSLDDKTAQRLTRSLHEGDIITSKKMETSLFNLNDLEGVEAAGFLSPGAGVGTSDLTVKIRNGKKAQTTLYAENYGNKSTGRYRYGLQENLNNLGGKGDQLRLGVLISNKDLRNYYLGYETSVGASGTRLGLSVSHMDYEIGAALQALGAEGKADTVSLYGSTPLWRTAYSSLAVTYGYDYRKLNDEFNNFPFADFKRQSHGFHMGLEGMERFDTSALRYNVTATAGTVKKDKDNFNRPSGSFTKGNANLTFIQQLGSHFDVMMNVQGQLAGKSLDSSEQMYLGGPRGIRAYQQGEASGDNGLLGTIEFRYHTPVKGLTLSTYYDAGQATHKDVPGSTSLQGWGIGITYSRPNDWFARFDYARRIGLPDDLQNVDSAKAKQRMWFMVGKIW